MIRFKQRNKRGFIMLVTAASLVVLVGMLGLAVDLGRVYIVKTEGQAFADFAAIAAARKLNSTAAGIIAAKAEVTNSTNKYNFGTQSFTSGNTVVEFATKTPRSTDCSGATWVTSPSSPFDNYGCVRVTVTPVVNLSFLPATGSAYTQTVISRAVAGVVPQSFPLGGYLPFSPFAHTPNCSAPNTPPGCDTTGNYGYTVGQEYGFHWPANVKAKGTACAGDQVNWPQYNVSDQVGSSIRGYFELQSAAAIRDAILGAKQTMVLNVGDNLNMTNGNKQTEATALTTRAGYDSDQTNYTASSSGTAPAYTGNGMRLVVMPINGGAPNFTVLGFGSFLLYTSYAVGGGNKPWCAIYMGSSDSGGSAGVFNVAGAYVVRLVQ